MAMGTSAVQPNQITALSQMAPQTMNGPQGPAAQHGTSFENHLDRVLHSNPKDSAESSSGAKNQKSQNPRDSAATGAASSNLQTPAIVAAPQNSSAPSAKEGSSSPSSSSSRAGPDAQNQKTGEASSRLVADSKFAWLMQMMPDFLGSQPLPGGASDAADASQKTSGQAQNSPEAANPAGTTPASDDSPATLETLMKASLGADGNLKNGPVESSATAKFVTNTSDASSTQGQDHSQQGNALPASSSAKSPRDDVRLSRAVASLESLDLKLFSTSMPQGGASQMKVAPAPSPSDTHGSATASGAAGALHAKPPLANTYQNTSRDADLLNTGSAQGSAQAHSNPPSPTSATAGSSGDPTKNGTSEDASGKRPDASGAGAGGNPSSVAGAASAASTSTAAQVAANGFPVPSNQAATGGNLPAHAAPSAQTSSSQTVPADRMAVENPLNPAGGVVNAASLLQTQGRTEMHVALNTESLGPLQLHAVLDGNRVGASIAVVNHEAHTLLTNELPALQQVLSDQNLRVEHLSVLSSPMHNGTGTGNGQSFHSGEFNQPRDNSPRWFSTASVPAAASSGKEALTPQDIRRRLSVRA